MAGNNVEVGIKVGESLTILVTDEPTGATATLTLTADGMFIPIEPIPEPPEPVDGAARWCAPLEATVSSRETGPIVALTAWGGQGWGYSYRYGLNGAPAGVTIDADTGVLSIAQALAVRDYSIGVVVTDRQDATLMALFDFMLHVVNGITHKTYKPEEFNGDVVAMGKKILVDQEAAGSGKLRARIEFAKGKTYTYTDNHWLTGVQYYECVAVGSGANPKLQNTHDASGQSYDQGPLNIGKGANCMAQIPYMPDSDLKPRMALIADAEVGDDVVTMLNAADGGKLRPGMWHAVMSYSQQITGYPPNVRWIDYVKVLSVDGTQVTLDRPLNHAHKADYWEIPGDVESIGKARIGPWELADGKSLATERGIWRDIEFLISPNYTVTYAESHIHLFMFGCKMPIFVPSMDKYVELNNCTLIGDQRNWQGGCTEPDKLCDMLVYNECDLQSYIGGCTGITYMLTRNSRLYPVQCSARQVRDIGSTVEAHGDSHFGVCWGATYQGPCLEREFNGTKFVANGNPPQWSWSSDPVDALPLSASSWQGNKLIIPRSFGRFESWLVWLHEGMMLFTGPKVNDPRSYGRVEKIYAPADGSALWADVTWLKGTKPTSGNLNIPQKGLRHLRWLPGTAITAGNWADPSYICMEGTPADRPFAEGID